jgi:hypothetical protein
MHAQLIPDSAAPAVTRNGSLPGTEGQRKKNIRETDILCSENKLFQITSPIYKKNPFRENGTVNFFRKIF